MRPARKVERLVARPFLAREEQAALDGHLMNEKHERCPADRPWLDPRTASAWIEANLDSIVVEPPRARKGRTA
jgi:hypothetical protein